MKILWVSSRIVGPAAKIINSDYKGTSGSWIQNEYERLDKSEHELFYICGTRNRKDSSVNKYTSKGETVYCIELPRLSYGIKPKKEFINKIQLVINEIQPDIIQIWGTETCLQDAIVEAADNIPMVVYIQGLIGMHNRYRGGYIDRSDPEYHKFVNIKRNIIARINNMLFKRQIMFEQRIINKAKYIFTDNIYTEAYCYSFSKTVKFVNRNLSPAQYFFDTKWKNQDRKKYSIYTVYGSSAEKGLHQLLKAVNIIKDEFEGIEVLIPGNFNISKEGELQINHNSSSFERWIKDYIDRNSLTKIVRFIGPMSQEQMALSLSECSVFVNPSCMEVHALSLREAMTVGVPCISTLCGSVAEFAQHGMNCFVYRFEEYEVLAYYLKTLLRNNDLAIQLGNNARRTITEKYTKNEEPLDYLYEQIIVGWNNV